MKKNTVQINALRFSGDLSLECRNGRFKLICGDNLITRFAGLNCAVKTMGMWTDSAQAKWQLLERRANYLRFSVVFNTIPLTQFWELEILEEHRLKWNVDFTVEEVLYIDEIRCLCMLNPLYQTWFVDKDSHPFQRFTPEYNTFYLSTNVISSVGVHPVTDAVPLPGIVIENKDKHFLSIIQNFPAKDRARVIGFKKDFFQGQNEFPPNEYPLLKSTILIGEGVSNVDPCKNDAVGTNAIVSSSPEISPSSQKRNRVLLANLPWRRDGKWGIRAGSRWPHISDCSEGTYLPFPFFLAYATSLLKQHEIDATIIDAIAEHMPEAEFTKYIKKEKPDFLVAETSIPSFYDDMALLKRLSALDISIIVCGPVAQIAEEDFLRDNDFVSFVIYGEYELVLLELLRALQSGQPLAEIRSVIYRDGDEIRKNTQRHLCSVSELPWPERDSLPMRKYIDAPGEMLTPSVQVLASRGCPFSCQFCLWPQVMFQGHTYRFRNAKEIVDEMQSLVRKDGFKSVYFDDDTFNVGKERMLEFCREIRHRGLEKTQWAIMARADLMDEEILDEMKLSGIWAVKYGVESADQGLVDAIGKNMDLKKTEKMIRYTQKLGIRTHLTFTFGLPGETHETIEKTIAWALELNPFTIQFSIMTPFPGTRYYELLKEKGQIITQDLSTYDGHFKSVIKSDILTPEDLERAKRRACQLWDKHIKTRKVQNGIVDLCDLLLIQCPPWDNSMPPLSIAYLSNYLYHQGMKVTVCDMNAYLSQHVSSKAQHLWKQENYDLWHDSRSFKKTFALIEKDMQRYIREVLEQCEPLCIGLSVNIAGIAFASRLIRFVKKSYPKIKIILGGWGCISVGMRSLFPRDLVDVFVVGEGEETLKEVMDYFKGDRKDDLIPGAIFASKGEKGEEEFCPRKPINNIDFIPWPSFKGFDLSQYTSPVLPVIGSRGCIGHCSFCNDWPFSRPYRFRTAHHIFDELKHHVEKFNIRVFSFKDLLCNGSMTHLELLCDLIIDEKFDIRWDSQAISRDEMTCELLEKMKKAGCTTLIYGVESFSNNVLKRMKKLFTAETCERVIRDTYRAGIKVFLNIIVGFPGETEEDFQATIDALKRNREYIAQVGAVSTCLINAESDLDLHPECYGILRHDNAETRAKEWWSSDGSNTYEIRRKRAGIILALLKELNYAYETVTM